jgi:5-methylcytosine-specific restriction protein A
MTKQWAKRPDDDKTLSSRRWQLLRTHILRREPLCRPCSGQDRVRLATEVDHIQHRAAGGEVFDEANLQPICAECHRVKSLREKGYRVPITIGNDGWPKP